MAYRAGSSLRQPLAGGTGPRKPPVPRRVHIDRSHNAIAQKVWLCFKQSNPKWLTARRNVTANGRDGGGAQS